MKRSTKNRVRMFDTVSTLMMTHQSSWSGNQGFEVGVQQFTALLEELKDAGVKQSSTYLGVKANQEVYLTDVCRKAMVLRDALDVYALDYKLPVVSEAIQYTSNQLVRSSQQEMRMKLARLAELVNTYSMELLFYGVTQEMIDTFQTSYTLFESEIVAVRIGLIERKMLTTRINDLDKKLIFLLRNKLDILMRLLAVEHPAFFQEYKSARLIIENKHTSIKEGPPKGEEDIGFAS